MSRATSAEAASAVQRGLSEREGHPGFTLIELLVSLSIFILMITAITPFMLRFQHTQRVGNVAEDLQHILRKAQHRALVGEHDSSWGVALLPAQYVLFAGETYASRLTRYDSAQSIPSSSTITTSPVLSEITFQRGTGLPTRTATITVLQASGFVRQVIVGSGGLVSLL